MTAQRSGLKIELDNSPETLLDLLGAAEATESNTVWIVCQMKSGYEVKRANNPKGAVRNILYKAALFFASCQTKGKILPL